MKWSAKDEAVKAIAVSYTEIYAALDEIADDNSYKPDVRNEARGLVTAPGELDTRFMIVFWRRVANRFVECKITVSNFLFFFRECLSDDGNNIRSAAERLTVAAYENDLETDINDEFVQFHKLLKTDMGKPVVEQHQSAESVELRMYKLITGANLQTFFSEHRTCENRYNDSMALCKEQRA